MSEPSSKEPSQKNRRIAMRRPVKGKVKVVCYKGSLDLGANIAVRVLDVSETGLRVLLTTALEKGQEVLIVLEGQGHMRPIKNPGRVVWSVPTEDAQFATGIQLDKYLKYKDLSHLT